MDCFIKKRNQFVKVHGRNKRDAVIFSLDCNEIVRSGCYTELTK